MLALDRGRSYSHTWQVLQRHLLALSDHLWHGIHASWRMIDLIAAVSRGLVCSACGATLFRDEVARTFLRIGFLFFLLAVWMVWRLLSPCPWVPTRLSAEMDPLLFDGFAKVHFSHGADLLVGEPRACLYLLRQSVSCQFRLFGWSYSDVVAVLHGERVPVFQTAAHVSLTLRCLESFCTGLLAHKPLKTLKTLETLKP